ncbi:hypothetical protein E1285_33550 [Actinomadura sp. 7K507]|nr:hypothetical protein E1285_33550 [Actinomadura sp. 7K507]
MRSELDALDEALPACDWLEVSDRAAGAIKLTPIDAAAEPRNLRRLKQAVQARWGTVPLIDMLKEAVLRTGCLQAVTSVAGRGRLPEHVLAERLLLAIYGYGTNTGIRAVAAGEHGHGEDPELPKLARSASDGGGSPRRCELGLHRCFRFRGHAGQDGDTTRRDDERADHHAAGWHTDLDRPGHPGSRPRDDLLRRVVRLGVRCGTGGVRPLHPVLATGQTRCGHQAEPRSRRHGLLVERLLRDG